MVGWHYRINGHELEQTPGDSEGQGSLVCCSPCGHEELDTTQQLNNNNLLYMLGLKMKLYEEKKYKYQNTVNHKYITGKLRRATTGK